jgi:hypothetical protein
LEEILEWHLLLGLGGSELLQRLRGERRRMTTAPACVNSEGFKIKAKDVGNLLLDMGLQ